MNLAAIATAAFIVWHPVPPGPAPNPPQRRPPPCSCDLPEGTLCVMSKHTCSGRVPPLSLVCGPGVPAGKSCLWPGAFVLNLADEGGNVVRQVAVIEGTPFVQLPPEAVRILWHLSISEAWTLCGGDFNLASHAEVVADGWCANPTPPRQEP